MSSPTAALPVPPEPSRFPLAGRASLSRKPLSWSDLVVKKIVSMKDYVALDFGEVDFVVEPIISVGGIVLCHGKPAHGKTQFATSLAQAIADGDDLGRYVATQGKVVLLQADTPARTQQRRLVKAVGAFKHPENFFIKVFDSAFDVLKVPLSTDWVQEVREIDPLLVIIDSLRMTHFDNENDAAVPIMVYSAWRELLGTKTALLFLHHDRKSYVGPGAGDVDTTESFRGSAAWLAHADTGIHIVKTKAANSPGKQKITAFFSKTRDCEDQEPLCFSMDKDTLLLNPANTPMSLREQAIQYLHLNQPSRDEYTRYLLDQLKMTKSTAYRTVEEFYGPSA